MASYYSSQQGRANPLGAPSGSSQMETNSAYLKDDAPHGPIATSAVNDDGKTQQWAEFFGLARKPIPNDPGMQYGRENYDLPEAYKGSVLYLDLLIIYQIKISQMYAITRLLPLRQWENSMSIRWDIWKFADGRLGRVPEETMSRMLTSTFDSGSATFHRWGLAFMLEHGFMNTPRGRMNYRCNLIQIANATIETLCFGVIVALLSCAPMSFLQSQAMTSINNEAQRDALFREELDQWGCVHKMPSPITWLWEKLAKKIRHRTSDEPNILFLPFGTRASTARPDETYYFLTGKTQDFNRGPQMPGAAVFESRDHMIGEGDVQDPAYQERIMGQYAYMLMSHLRNIKDCDFLTPMMDIAMISESDDAFTRISYYQCVEECGLFSKDKQTGKWRLNEIATTYFGGNYTYGNYLQEVGMLDKWCNQLADGCKKRRMDFLARFGDTKDQKGTTAKTNAGAAYNNTPGNSFLSADGVTLANEVLTGAVARSAAPAGPSAPAAAVGGAGAGAGAGAGGAQFSAADAAKLRDLASLRDWIVSVRANNATAGPFSTSAELNALDNKLAPLVTAINKKADEAKLATLEARVKFLEDQLRAAGQNPAPTGPAEAERRAILTNYFNKSNAGTPTDKWTTRFAAIALYSTGDEDLKGYMEDAFGPSGTFNGEEMLGTAIVALDKAGNQPALAPTAVSLDGARSVSATTIPNGWIMTSPVLAANSSADTGAAGMDSLYSFVQTYLVQLKSGTTSAAGARNIEQVLVKFHAEQKIAGKPKFSTNDAVSNLQLAYAEFINIVNNTANADAGAWAKDIIAKINNGSGFNLVNGWTVNEATAAAAPFIVRAKGAGLSLGGRFTEEVKYDVGQRQDRKDKGAGIMEPDYTQMQFKEHLFRQLPLLTDLMGSKKNMYAFYHSLVVAPKLAAIAGPPANDRNRALYPLSEMAFEHLNMLVEDEYARRIDKLNGDAKTKGWTEDAVDDKRTAIDDSLKHLLQEFAFQRLLNMEDIVENTAAFRPLFNTQMRPTALMKAAEDAKFSGEQGSLSKTLDVFERLLPKLSDDFLTAWHNKLPEDVLWRLDQRNVAVTLEKKGGGITLLKEAYARLNAQAQLSGVDSDAMDLKDDVPADYFKSLLLNMRIRDGELIRFGLDRNLWPVIGMLLHKLYGTWLMGQAFAMLGDGRVGYTFQGHHDFQLQDDAIHKMHVGHWTLYARPIVIRADGVGHAFNIRSERYIGGNENTIWNINDSEDRIKFKTRNFYHRSIIPVPVRINRADPYWNYDVTGAYNKHLGPTPSYCTDPSLAMWAKAWGIIQDGKNPLTRPIIPRDDVRGNTMVFLTSFLRYEEKTKALSDRVFGRSGWGADEYNGCCQVRRGLNVPLLKVGAPGTNIVSIVY